MAQMDLSSPRKKRLTLRRLLDSNEEVWVRNNSGNLFKNKVCNVVFQIGKPPAIDVVVVPPGDDPVCLTDQVDPESLRTCMDLFKLIKREALVLLDPEDADKYYQQNQERKRIMEEKIDTLASRRMTDAAKKAGVKPAGQSVNLNPKVGDICLRSRHSAITERQALEKLMEIASILTEDDVSYLVNNGVYAGVKRWAQSKLNEMFASTSVKEEFGGEVSQDPEEAFAEQVKKTRKRKAKIAADPIEQATS